MKPIKVRTVDDRVEIEATMNLAGDEALGNAVLEGVQHWLSPTAYADDVTPAARVKMICATITLLNAAAIVAREAVNNPATASPTEAIKAFLAAIGVDIKLTKIDPGANN